MNSQDRKYPIQYIKICFLKYSSLIERTADDNQYENVDKNEWKNSFKYRL